MQPRKYQIEGIEFLREKGRAMLCDAPGLGKTLQAVEAAKDFLPVLVVCPTYLVDQWADFLEEEYGANVARAKGTAAARQKALNAKADWTVCNIEMLRGDYEFAQPTTIIFDESHHLRNRDAKQSKTAAEFAHAVERVYLLTGTPIVRDPDDIWHQLYMINKDEFRSYESFVLNNFRCYWGLRRPQIIGFKNKADFQKMVGRYALGRTYKDVGLYLPEVISSNIRVPLEPDMWKMYVDIRDFYGHADFSVHSYIEAMHALRYITSRDRNKVNATVSLCQEHGKFVVFTDYVDSAKRIAEATGAVCITGAVPPLERKEIAQNADRIVATIDTLREGVDLSHLNVAIFFEEDYTYGVMKQALSRLQRWSQEAEANKRPVLAYYVHGRNTIDEIVHKKQTLRTVNAKDVVLAELKR